MVSNGETQFIPPARMTGLGNNVKGYSVYQHRLGAHAMTVVASRQICFERQGALLVYGNAIQTSSHRQDAVVSSGEQQFMQTM